MSDVPPPAEGARPVTVSPLETTRRYMIPAGQVLHVNGYPVRLMIDVAVETATDLLEVGAAVLAPPKPPA